MKRILEVIEEAKADFKNLLEHSEKNGGLTKERYARFLTMQYHLTKGVQEPFMFIAAHPATARRRPLRKFLIQFAQEEEFHFEIAKADLAELGLEPGEKPLDANLWWLYFTSVIRERPFVRLGATTILENVSDGAADILDRMIKSSGYLTPKNLRFLMIHRHGPNLDHGNQIINALTAAEPNEAEMADLIHGAVTAKTLYLRLLHWVITGENK